MSLIFNFLGLMADLQVETDLRNVHSHGTRMLPGYIRSILKGEINPVPQVHVVQEGPAFAVIDGDNGLGPPSSVLAMKMAIEKAKLYNLKLWVDYALIRQTLRIIFQNV